MGLCKLLNEFSVIKCTDNDTDGTLGLIADQNGPL